MRLWVRLYGMIWLAFVQIWLAYTPLAPPIPVYLHVVLGVALVVLAYRNFVTLRAASTVGRIKRTARATFALTLLLAVLGGALYLHVGSNVVVLAGITLEGGLRFLHFVNAMAVFAQVCATAVVYDVWEEQEFLRPSAPGEIPPPPAPVR